MVQPCMDHLSKLVTSLWLRIRITWWLSPIFCCSANRLKLTVGWGWQRCAWIRITWRRGVPGCWLLCVLAGGSLSPLQAVAAVICTSIGMQTTIGNCMIHVIIFLVFFSIVGYIYQILEDSCDPFSCILFTCVFYWCVSERTKTYRLFFVFFL
jgi:hypothetical protein